MGHKSMMHYILINKKMKENNKLRYMQLTFKSRRKEHIQTINLMVLQHKTIIN